ncbi:c-type cytochrome [Thiobacter aerophilum]|uniref:Cytochrome c domain-containing protein n=1 Tax=Thiobacter aerophilum TaxID=3121275 RepID=A0ABV0EJ46_9BURK
MSCTRFGQVLASRRSTGYRLAMQPANRVGVLFSVLAMMSAQALAGDAGRGEAIFRSTCASCHVKPTRLKTPLSQIREKLASRAIPAHQLVHLSEQDCEDLLAHIAAKR